VYQRDLEKLIEVNQLLKQENEQLRAQLHISCGESFGRKEEIMTAIFPSKSKERKNSRRRNPEENGSRRRKPSVSPLSNKKRAAEGKSTERKPAKSHCKNIRALSQTNVEIFRREPS
jgi:hypothetical protein